MTPTATAVPIVTVWTIAEAMDLIFVLVVLSDCPPWRGVDSPSSIVAYVIVNNNVEIAEQQHHRRRHEYNNNNNNNNAEFKH